MFASDGMRPDLMKRFSERGIMPTFKDLRRKGVEGKNGLLQGFPPNTGVGWHTLATGTWPGEHGSTNNTFHRTGDAFNNTTSFATPGVLQADTALQAAERAGKKVVAMEWVAARGLLPALQGPVVDFRTFIGGRGIVLNFDLPGQPALANSFSVQYQRQTLADATGWTNVPASFSPAKETTFTHANAQIPGGGVVERVHLRLDQQRHRQLQPRADRQQRGRQGREQVSRQPRTGRLGRREAQARLRRVGRTHGRLLREADRPQQRRVAVPPLLHLGPARERDVQRARPSGLGGVRRDPRPRLPDLDRGRLRAARGADRRRGHLRRAGPDVGRRALRVPALHLQHARLRAGRRLHRQPGDGRVQPPVPRTDGSDGHGRSAEPVLRRCQRRRHEGPPPRRAERLHRGRLPRGRRDARARPLADGQEGHDRVRLVRPRLRAAVAGHQRPQDPLRHEGAQHRLGAGRLAAPER